MADARQYVTLGLDRDVLAVPVEAVREILDLRDMAMLPQAPSWLLGMIDVRGRAVPVIDLRLRLGLPPVAATSSTRILVLEAAVGGQDLMLGLLADRVFEVTGLDGDAIEPPPEIGQRWHSDAIAGVGRRAGGFVVVLDLGRLLASDETVLADVPSRMAA